MSVKLVDLNPNTTFVVDQWTLKQSKYGYRFLLKVHEKDTTNKCQVWSNSQLFDELSAISAEKVNFAKMLNIEFTFTIIGEGEYMGNKTVKLETSLD